MSPEDEFARLIASARLGEAAALAELWSRHSATVAGFVRARGAREVDEVTSDVFLAAFRGLDRFEGDEGGFRALLFTIARRRLVDEARRRARQVPVVAWRAADDDRSVADVADEVGARLEAADLLALVHRLTPDQRDVVLLRLVAGLSIEEAAAVVGKPPGAVKSLQRRGLEALRRLLASGPHHEGVAS